DSFFWDHRPNTSKSYVRKNPCYMFSSLCYFVRQTKLCVKCTTHTQLRDVPGRAFDAIDCPIQPTVRTPHVTGDSIRSTNTKVIHVHHGEHPKPSLLELHSISMFYLIKLRNSPR